MSSEELFQCPVCGLHYRDDETAKECEKFCRANNACSIEIAKLAVEYSGAEQETVDES
jgi:hypothetical protein